MAVLMPILMHVAVNGCFRDGGGNDASFYTVLVCLPVWGAMVFVWPRLSGALSGLKKTRRARRSMPMRS